MATPFIGEIKMFGGNFAIRGWAFCDGSLVPITSNEALYQLIGTTFGGDGQTTFALPNLQGRMPVHVGSGFVLGQQGGSESVTLNQNQLPGHTHTAQAQSAAGNLGSPSGAVWAQSTLNQYSSAAANATMNPALIQPTGGNQPHENMMPFLTVTFLIALEGVFPTQN
jgi:microcystin-dependent protein